MLSTYAKYIETVFSPRTFLPLILALLFVTEASGSPLVRNGGIHAIAIIFVGLAVARMRFRYYIADPISEKFITASLIAMATFALSHVVELFSHRVLSLPKDVVFANTAGFYLIGIFVILIGLEFIRRAIEKRFRVVLWMLFGAVGSAVFLIVFYSFFQPDSLSLGPSSINLYAFMLVIVVTYAFGLWGTRRVSQLFPVLHDFGYSIHVALGFMAVAATLNVISEILKSKAVLPEHQLIDVAHLAFFLSLSLFFSAFGKLKPIKGIYDEVLQMNPPRGPLRLSFMPEARFAMGGSETSKQCGTPGQLFDFWPRVFMWRELA